jgi:hypothetical protein
MAITEYLDFELRVEQGTANTYPVCLLRSPAGEASGFMTLQPSDWQDKLDIVANARGSASSRGSGTAVAADPIGFATTWDMGQALFEALMIPPIRTCYATSFSAARSQGKGLRLRLRIQAPELAALPWEYLIDQDRNPLTLASTTPVVRHLEMPFAALSLKLHPPVRVLGMIGFHRNLDVDAEKALIERATESLRTNGTMHLDWVPGHSWRDLQTALGAGTYHVFHFIGHGEFDPQSRTGKLLLEAEGAPGAPFRLDAADLGALLSDHASLRLVVLNSCEGARASDTSLFSSTASIVAKKGIPAVVSMQYEISDGAALEFARTFYEFLSRGLPIEVAVSEARRSIELAAKGRNQQTVEWGTPVLHLRAGDGVLFELDIGGALGLSPAPKAAPAAPPAPAPAPSARGLAILAGKVKSYWIDGVLQRKQELNIHIGLDKLSGVVDDPFGADDSSFVDTSEGSESLGDRSATDVFSDCGNCLLILGDPGSGKTVLLLQLARDLLAASDPAHALPVVFNLSSWAATQSAFADWLVSELAAKYLIPKAAAQSWLTDGRILPLLDGLDEVAAPARPACVDAINTWIPSAQAGMAVCCRFKEYNELPAKLCMNAAIRLQPLTRDQVFAFVGAATNLAALRAMLEGDSELLELARTPLMLAVMVRAFQGLDPASVVATPPEGLAARRTKVMAAFTSREFQRAREGGSLV